MCFEFFIGIIYLYNIYLCDYSSILYMLVYFLIIGLMDVLKIIILNNTSILLYKKKNYTFYPNKYIVWCIYPTSVVRIYE